MSTSTILNLAEELRVIADEISDNANAMETSSDFPKRGTIVKALPAQNRFKAKSMWVSLGDGTYKHLTGSKGLTTNQSRLDGYTEVIFQA
jgi:hypothetical protein